MANREIIWILVRIHVMAFRFHWFMRTETKIVNSLLVVGGVLISVLASSFVSRSPLSITELYLPCTGWSIISCRRRSSVYMTARQGVTNSLLRHSRQQRKRLCWDLTLWVEFDSHFLGKLTAVIRMQSITEHWTQLALWSLYIYNHRKSCTNNKSLIKVEEKQGETGSNQEDKYKYSTVFSTSTCFSQLHVTLLYGRCCGNRVFV